MKNDTRSNVHHRHTALCLALSAALFTAPVSAEVGLPPPAQHQGAGFPSEQALRQKGYDPKTGVWRVQSQNNGRPTVTKSGDSIRGSQPKTVTATGNYGEKGTFRTTQTQTVSSSKLQNTVNGVWVGGALANAVDKHIDLMDARIRSGDYKGAVESGVLMAGTFGNNLFGGIAESLGNMGRRLGLIDSPSPQDFRQAADRFYQWQMQKEQGGDLGEAIAAAAAKKAAEQAAKAAERVKQAEENIKKAEAGKNIILIRFRESAYDKENGMKMVEKVSWKSYESKSSSKRVDYGNFFKSQFGNKLTIGIRQDLNVVYNYNFKANKYDQVVVSVSEFLSTKENLEQAKKTDLKVEDMMLNQQDIKDILSRMLNNQQTNHAELMNQLSKIGDAVQKSTESNQFTPMTADSAPYTPQGSNTPQQTRFTLNADGSVSTSIIPRPDLKPNSTLAPTRSEIIPTPNKGQNTPTTPNSPNTPTTPDSPNVPTTPNSPNTPNTPNNPTGQQNQNQENQKQDFCQQNPNAAQCMSGGDTTYEDIVLPENTIDLSFSPENVFQTEGVCPQPKSVDLGAFGQVEFSYQPLCDFAAKLRPVLIMMTILTCAWFVYGALEEL
ncbi:virulence factor TspB C-terminal domain-related protein [Neisseria mucosa]|uniref:virulence factor TspB C-terminal domain-related protein n=1 Tax=Neisseria mucosa TaxID=488 RepID=UPI0027DFA062|nr:virulence factor TspB C-terminal domain-related protein [Neisseria mucosa]